MPKLICYFAHPYEYRNHEDKYKFLKILQERMQIITPFEDEEELMESYKRKNYYPNPPFKLGLDIWIKDLAQIRSCDVFVLWSPEPSLGCGFELSYAYFHKKFIQIISEKRHPSFAYVLRAGNQQFDSIDAFDKLRQLIWD